MSKGAEPEDCVPLNCGHPEIGSFGPVANLVPPARMAGLFGSLASGLRRRELKATDARNLSWAALRPDSK